MDQIMIGMDGIWTTLSPDVKTAITMCASIVAAWPLIYAIAARKAAQKNPENETKPEGKDPEIMGIAKLIQEALKKKNDK